MLNPEKLKKIKKFEKVISSFCDNIGVDMQTFINALMPEKNIQATTTGAATGKLNESLSSDIKDASVNSNFKGQSIDTGKAAMLAYTNLENSTFDEGNQVQTDWRKSQVTRNNPVAKNSSGEFNNGVVSEAVRSTSLGNGRFVDSSSTSKRTNDIREQLRAQKRKQVNNSSSINTQPQTS